LKHVKQLTAPLSAVFLILVAGFAFTNLQARTEYPPPILDPEFGLWVSDHDLGGQRPLVWQFEYWKSAGDQILLQQSRVAGREALEIQIFQDGTDKNWTYVRLGQAIDGTRLRALLDEEVGVWVFLDASCACNRVTSDQPSTFGIETNDGTHTFKLLFAETTAEMSVSPTDRVIFLQTPIGDWAHHPIDLVKQYNSAMWKPPDHITLSILFGVSGSATGWHTVYVHGFSVAKRTQLSPMQQQKSTLSSISETGLFMPSAIDQCMTVSQDTYLSETRTVAAFDTGCHKGLIVVRAELGRSA
jgi:hypothetical protein